MHHLEAQHASHYFHLNDSGCVFTACRYSMIWAASAVQLLLQPTPYAVYVCWTVAHTYATVRVFVGALTEAGCFGFKARYSIGTSAGALFVILTVFDRHVSFPLVALLLGVPFLLGDRAARLHVHNSRGGAAKRAVFPFQHYKQQFVKDWSGICPYGCVTVPRLA